jgi:hypothetical protein
MPVKNSMSISMVVIFSHHVHMNAKTILEALHGTKCPTGATMTLSSFAKKKQTKKL